MCRRAGALQVTSPVSSQTRPAAVLHAIVEILPCERCFDACTGAFKLTLNSNLLEVE